MTTLGALSQSWGAAEASLPLGGQIRGLWRFDGLSLRLLTLKSAEPTPQTGWRLPKQVRYQAALCPTAATGYWRAHHDAIRRSTTLR